SISGAYAREGQLEPGVEPDAKMRRRGRRVMIVAAVLILLILTLGRMWWNSDDSAFQRFIYKPLKMTAGKEPGDRLRLRLESAGWGLTTVDDMLPDHGHLMHLYVVRLPEIERVWHLHPEQDSAGSFSQNLPSMPGGHYRLYADIVHATGLP